MTTTTPAGELAGILRPATSAEPRLKLLTYGTEGSYKTRGALEIATAIGGKIAVLDPERGTRLYASEFAFDVLPTDDIDRLQRAIRLLAQGGHEYRTLIIDPISLLWAAWLEQWEDRFLRKNTSRAGHRGEWYEMGMKDWAPVKRSWDALIRTCVNLDMNLLVTARESIEYEGSGDNLRKVGTKPDTEKRVGYWFDVMIRQSTTRTGKFLAETVKDRTGRLPAVGPAWDFTAAKVVEAFGSATLSRAVRATLAEEDIIEEIRRLGGILGMSIPEMNERARKKYGAPTIEELLPEDAATVVANLRAAVKSKNQGSEAKE